MAEEISTPVETTPTDTSIDSAPEVTQEVTDDTAPAEPVNVEEAAETTEPKKPEDTEPKLYAGKFKSVEELEKGYNEAQKYVRESAELKKQLQQQQPQIVNEYGQIDKRFEQQYRQNIDNQEFMAYVNGSRGLDIETRQEVEDLLVDAQRLYLMGDKAAYTSKLAEVKQHFNPNVIEQIAQRKLMAENAMQQEFERAKYQQKYDRGAELAKNVEADSELFSLLNAGSENYMPELFQIFKDTFDIYGSVNVTAFKNVINKVKELGVKQYLAAQEIEKTKGLAQVPSGNNTVKTEPKKLTSEQLETQEFWEKFYSK